MQSLVPILLRSREESEVSLLMVSAVAWSYCETEDGEEGVELAVAEGDDGETTEAILKEGERYERSWIAGLADNELEETS